MSDLRYPLNWPAGWQRTPSGKRIEGRYKVTETRAKDDLLHSIKMLGGSSVQLSTNIQLRKDGLPYANRSVDDPGVAIYFTWKGGEKAIACDAYRSIAANYRDIWQTLEALRTISNNGSSQILDRVFTGFSALPAAYRKVSWREVFGWEKDLPVRFLSKERVMARYRELAHIHHPDKGGVEAQMVELNAALAEALAELGNV